MRRHCELIAIRRAERKIRTVRPRFVDRARERRAGEQALAVSGHVRPVRADRVRPVGVEQERRGTAIRKTEMFARSPFAII